MRKWDPIRPPPYRSFRSSSYFGLKRPAALDLESESGFARIISGKILCFLWRIDFYNFLLVSEKGLSMAFINNCVEILILS